MCSRLWTQHKCFTQTFYKVCIWMLNYFQSIKITVQRFYLLMPPDGEGRGGPDPLQIPEGEPGQRVLSATWCTQTEIWAAGLYESVTLSVCLHCVCLPASARVNSCLASHDVARRKNSPLASIIIITLLSSLYYQSTLGPPEPAKGTTSIWNSLVIPPSVPPD